MRKHIQSNTTTGYKIIAVDDDSGVLDSLSVLLNRNGYNFVGITDPIQAIERVKKEHFDLMLLDFMMTPIHGDKVVEEIRKFNKELYILLLTGHKDLAPPLETIRKLDIQCYCEKSDKFDQLLLLVEAAIKSVEQLNEINRINNELSDAYSDLEKAYLDMVETLRFTVEARDPYTRGHSDINTLKIGGLFHDIGKIGIPDSILLKDSKLTDDEYSEIKNHPSIGAHILCNAKVFQDIIPIVKHHHERYDGKGYPSQLAGEDIPYFARIAAVADTFDAMTSKRTYRDALPLEFDPKIAKVFLDILNKNYEEIQKIQEQYR